jgi:endonuclease/exonuclease/phosphatase family metal-dependent hydrolase
MRVATYNAHRGRGPVGWFRPDRIRAVIAEIRPDLIALQEAQFYLRRGADMLGAAAIERELGLRPLPVAAQPAHQGWRSNVVLVPPSARLLRPARGLRLGGAEPRGAVLAELDLGSGPFRLIATHLSLGAATRARQGELLLAAMAEGAGADLPTLLLGDLNEWRPDRSVLRALRPVFGDSPAPASFPAFRPTLALDRILGSAPGMVRGLAAHDTPLARRASDHLPLVAELHLPRRPSDPT